MNKNGANFLLLCQEMVFIKINKKVNPVESRDPVEKKTFLQQKTHEKKERERKREKTNKKIHI